MENRMDKNIQHSVAVDTGPSRDIGIQGFQDYAYLYGGYFAWNKGYKILGSALGPIYGNYYTVWKGCR